MSLVSTTSSIDLSNGLRIADFAREVARDATRLAVTTVNRALVAGLPGAPASPEADGMMSFETDHRGDAPIELDVIAHDAAWGHASEQFSQVIPHRTPVIDAGEESGVPTRALRPGMLIGRQDSLDGSTNAKSMWLGWSSVMCIDEVRDTGQDSARVRHHAGAITTNNGWTVSWVNDSHFDPNRRRYNTVRGRVFLSGESWGVPEFQLEDVQWNRVSGSVAAVASKPARYAAVLQGLEAAGVPILFNFGGTPIVGPLLAGGIERVVEPYAVTLHDSAHLIPHQLLGGRTSQLDDGVTLDYLALYEREGIHLDPARTPVPPYVAHGGVA